MNLRMLSRRKFIEMGAMACGAARLLSANPLGLPIGLELYTVENELKRDLAGTLKAIAQIGYKTVEWPQFATKAGAVELKRALDEVGLRCPSVHYTMFDLQEGFESAVKAAKALGAEYLICSAPMPRDAKRKLAEKDGSQRFYDAVNNMAIDDWKWNADQLNHYGELAHKAGLQLGYHNHNVEFQRFGGVVPYDLLLHSTEPKLVVFEMDCGWVTVAGESPAGYIEKYPNRVRMLHVKDFRPGFKPTTVQAEGVPTPTELGRGSIAYQAIFKAAKQAGVRYYFVEQEPPFREMPVLEAIKTDFEYLHNLV